MQRGELATRGWCSAAMAARPWRRQHVRVTPVERDSESGSCGRARRQGCKQEELDGGGFYRRAELIYGGGKMERRRWRSASRYERGAACVWTTAAACAATASSCVSTRARAVSEAAKMVTAASAVSRQRSCSSMALFPTEPSSSSPLFSRFFY